MFELQGKQYSFEELTAVAAQFEMSLDDYIVAMKPKGLKEINESEGKTTSQGQGAPVAETVAPDQISTESTLEDGSLGFQTEIVQDKDEIDQLNLEPIDVNALPEVTREAPSEDVKAAAQLARDTENARFEFLLNEALKKQQESLKDTSTISKIGNSFNNMSVNIRAFDDKLTITTASLAKQLLGAEGFKKAQESSFWGIGMQNKDIRDSERELKLLEAEQGKTGEIIEGIKEGDVGEIFSGIIDGLTSIGSTAVTNTLTGGAGLFTDAYADAFITINEEKAKEKGVLVSELSEEELDKWTPAGVSVIVGIAEKFGLSSSMTNSVLRIATSTGGKKILNRILAGSEEAATEWVQFGVDTYAGSIGKGKSKIDAGFDALKSLFTQDAFEGAIKGAVGGSSMANAASVTKLEIAEIEKAAKGLRSKVDVEKIETLMDNIAVLNKRKTETDDPEVLEGINKAIKEKEEQLKGTYTNANSIINFATRKEIKDINDTQDLAQAQLKRVQSLKQKLKEGKITEDQYDNAYAGYITEYKAQKAKIDGIKQDLTARKTEGDSKVQEVKGNFDNLQNLYDTFEGNVNKMLGATLTKDSKGNQVNEKVENSIFGRQVGKLAESLTKKLFDPITPDARNGVTREEYKRTIINNAATIVATEKFDPAKQNLDKFLSSRLYLRTNALAKELGIESIQEQGGMGIAQDVTTVKDAMATETSEDTIERSERVKETATRAKIIDQLSFRSKGLNLFSDAAKKALSGKLPPVTDARAFKAALDDAFRTALTVPMKNFSGTRKDYDRFLDENWKQLYDIIPQDVINKRFDEFKVPIINPKTGKQKRLTMAEGTANGELVFGKKDITKEEFINYFKAKGSTKAARKNTLAEMLATQIGFDEVLEALADPEINKKFKDIQELQGQEVPANYGARVAKIVDRLDQLAKMLEADPNVLSSSFLGITEITRFTIVQAIKTLSAAIKGGAKLVDALGVFKKAVAAEFETKEYKEQSNDLANKYFKSVEDLNKTSIAKYGEELSNLQVKQMQELGIDEGSAKTLANRLSNPDLSTESKATIVKDFIQNEQKSYSKFNEAKFSSYELFFKNAVEPILKVAAPELLGKESGFAWDYTLTKAGKKWVADAKKGTFKTHITYKGEKISEAKSKIETLFKNKNVNALQDRNAKAMKYITDLMDYYIETGQIVQGISHIKLLTEATEGSFRSTGNAHIHVETKEKRVPEHDPPVYALFKEVAKAMRGEESVSKVKDLLGRAHINYIPKSVDDVLRAEGLQQSLPNGADIYTDTYARMDNPKVVAAMKKYKKTTTILANTKTEQDNKAIVDAEINATETVTPPSDKESRVMASAIDDMVQRKKGISKEKTVSAVEAKAIGKNKGRFKVFIPPSAEDFKGLVYSLMGAGKQGNIDAEFFSEKLFKPLAKANYILNAERQNLKAKFKNLIDNNKGVTKELRKETGYSFFSNDHAVRVFMWDKLGYEIPGLSATEQNELIKIVESNPKLKKFAEEIIVIPNKNESWLKPKEEWAASTVEMDLQDTISKTGRKRIFAEFIQNADIIFNENALNKLEAAYGTPYVTALKSMLKRIETGRSNESVMGASESAFLNWVRGSVATTMFFNTRSALLQQLSLVNFTNWADNNPVAQAKAMADTKQWGKDWAMIFNSDWMKERRQGLKTDINESELVASLEGSNNSYKSLLNTLLKNGFALTKYGDNIAIATGGAAFFRNRANAYAKKGMSKEAAEKQAFLDFQEIAEETQQSSRQDLLSNQQVTTFGKFFLAFANTPMQMTRLTKKAFLDLANGRGDAKTNISKIVYYGAVQNMIFSALQNALFAAFFSDDDEEDQKLIDGKTERAINNVLDSLLRGSGIAGSAIATVKNVILRARKEFNKGYKGDDTYILLEAANIAPPIGIKARKLYGAYKNYKMNQKTVKYIGFDNINHPYYGIAGATASGVLNIPLDRVMTKANNLKEAFDSQNEAWQRIALSVGYSTWELGIKDKEIELARRLAKQKLGKPKKTSLKSNLKGSLGTNKLKGSLD